VSEEKPYGIKIVYKNGAPWDAWFSTEKARDYSWERYIVPDIEAGKVHTAKKVRR
jgi:hypothetical protein